MAKRSSVKSISKQRVKVEPEPKAPTVRYLQLQYPARVRHQGTSTGKWYTWAGSGAVVPVDVEDAEYLLTVQMNKNPCCGDKSRPQPKFVEV